MHYCCISAHREAAWESMSVRFGGEALWSVADIHRLKLHVCWTGFLFDRPHQIGQVWNKHNKIHEVTFFGEMLVTISDILSQSSNLTSLAINFCAITSDLPDLKISHFAHSFRSSVWTFNCCWHKGLGLCLYILFVYEIQNIHMIQNGDF